MIYVIVFVKLVRGGRMYRSALMPAEPRPEIASRRRAREPARAPPEVSVRPHAPEAALLLNDAGLFPLVEIGGPFAREDVSGERGVGRALLGRRRVISSDKGDREESEYHIEPLGHPRLSEMYPGGQEGAHDQEGGRGDGA